MSGVSNTGVVNFISNPVVMFPKNSITVDIFGNVFYRNYEYGAGDDTGVYWSTQNIYTEKQMLFLATAMGKSLLGLHEFDTKLRSSRSLKSKVLLPVRGGEIDFDFMEGFIAELEAQRIAELEAYLTATGLNDYKLTDEEVAVLEMREKWEWGQFNLERLFGKSTRGKRLKSEDRVSGPLPFVTAGEACEGVSSFIGNKVEVFSENTTTIDMFGSAKYRNYKYGADDHVAVVHTESLPRCASLFVEDVI